MFETGFEDMCDTVLISIYPKRLFGSATHCCLCREFLDYLELKLVRWLCLDRLEMVRNKTQFDQLFSNMKYFILAIATPIVGMLTDK